VAKSVISSDAVFLFDEQGGIQKSSGSLNSYNALIELDDTRNATESPQFSPQRRNGEMHPPIANR